MNVKEKDRIMIEVRDLLDRFSKQKDTVEMSLQNQKDMEEEKLDNLPESLSNTSISQGIEDSISNLLKLRSCKTA